MDRRDSERRRTQRRRRRHRKKIISRVVVLCALFAALIGVGWGIYRLGAYFLNKIGSSGASAQEEAASSEESSDDITLLIDNEDVSRLSQDEALTLLMKKYSWNLVITNGSERYEVENLVEEDIKDVVEQAYKDRAAHSSGREARERLGSSFPGGGGGEDGTLRYELSLADPESCAGEIAEAVGSLWDSPAKDSALSSFDSSQGRFIVSEGESGRVVDREDLLAKLGEVFESGDFKKELPVSMTDVSPSINAADFKVIGSYTTTTTANKDRNTNVRLASEGINGLILSPGEQFSFNTVLGPRTAEKGYKQAGAYADGQTVLEYGGGVCQVSSTLYNAVIAAGLRTDSRVGHSFEPSYVTPGQDATVSYANPDFKFTNTSKADIGIHTSFQDRTMRVELFGVPMLEEGVKRYLKSEKTAQLDPPVPNYTEDPTVPFGTEVVDKASTAGSVWTTNIVTEKNGEIIDETYLHQTRYKGHAGSARRNTLFPQPPQSIIMPDGTIIPLPADQTGAVTPDASAQVPAAATPEAQPAPEAEGEQAGQ